MRTPTSKRHTADSYLHNNVNELLSLKDNVVVITGAARGIGLALAFAVVEAGGQVAVIDASPEPHEHFEILKQRGDRVEYYQ
jgi:sorbose reductase